MKHLEGNLEFCSYLFTEETRICLEASTFIFGGLYPLSPRFNQGLGFEFGLVVDDFWKHFVKEVEGFLKLVTGDFNLAEEVFNGGKSRLNRICKCKLLTPLETYVN